MSASVLVVSPSLFRAAFHAVLDAIWLRFAAAFLIVRACIDTGPASLRGGIPEADEDVPPTLRSPGSVR